MSDCALCERPILDTALACVECGQRTAKRLTQQAPNFAEMTIAITRQARFGDPARLSSAEPPLPFDVDAAIEATSVTNTLRTWATHIAQHRGTQPPNTGQNLMLWLAAPSQINWLRYRSEAAQALDELDYAAGLVERCIDAPAQHTYAGPCWHNGCQGELYGRAGAAFVTCRDCGTSHDSADRRAWLLGEANDVLGTATEIARFVSAMRGDMVTAAQVRGYAHRGRIISRGVDRDGRATYRVGDVLDTLGRINA